MQPARILVLLTLSAVNATLATACAPLVKLPHSRLIDDHAPLVTWHPATPASGPTITLMPNRGGAPLAQVPSLFTPDAVEALGEPAGNRFLIFTSPTDNTILVHENASESSPSEHLVIFTRNVETDTWSARMAWPPQREGGVYGYRGISRGVDDTYLYYQFPDGALRRTKLSALAEKPSS